MVDPTMRRREFLRSASALGLGAGLGTSASLAAITPTRAEMVVTPEAVQFRPEIEPIVRWIEETPRNQAFDRAVEHLRHGLSYRDLMAGLFLAGIRNIQPRPVGFKFHAVMVINSAHLIAQSAAEEDRLLPMFWALDNFKRSQAQDVEQGDWTLLKVDEARVPSPGAARRAFEEAMDAWDADAADVAVAGLCRGSGAAETMEAFWKYAVRDQRNIGHKPIFAMQCWRTLQAVGWEHAEPVLRSLAYGMLDTQGDRPRAVGPYEVNKNENAGKIRDGWSVGRAEKAATVALIEALRQASPEEASAEVVKLLNDGIDPGSLWDAVVMSASEIMLQAPGIAPLHAVTSANAMHFVYHASGDDTTRKLALLQAAGWMPLFRSRVESSQRLALDRLEPAALDSSGDEAAAEAFATIAAGRRQAAAKAIAYLEEGGDPEVLFGIARRMIFHKADDSHQYKYGAAAWEEYRLATDPTWRTPIAASALAYFPGTHQPDNALMTRARQAVERVLGTG